MNSEGDARRLTSRVDGWLGGVECHISTLIRDHGQFECRSLTAVLERLRSEHTKLVELIEEHNWNLAVPKAWQLLSMCTIFHRLLTQHRDEGLDTVEQLMEEHFETLTGVKPINPNRIRWKRFLRRPFDSTRSWL